MDGSGSMANVFIVAEKWAVILYHTFGVKKEHAQVDETFGSTPGALTLTPGSSGVGSTLHSRGRLCHMIREEISGIS
jgi:uncharacterized transporter YbjL